MLACLLACYGIIFLLTLTALCSSFTNRFPISTVTNNQRRPPHFPRFPPSIYTLSYHIYYHHLTLPLLSTHTIYSHQSSLPCPHVSLYHHPLYQTEHHHHVGFEIKNSAAYSQSQCQHTAHRISDPPTSRTRNRWEN